MKKFDYLYHGEKTKSKQKTKSKSKKHSKSDEKWKGGTIVVLIVMTLIMAGVFYLVYDANEGYEWFKEEVEYIKSLDWQPENSTVTYYMHLAKPNYDNWTNFFCFIDYEEDPWNNTKGYIWFRHTGEWYFEEYIEDE